MKAVVSLLALTLAATVSSGALAAERPRARTVADGLELLDAWQLEDAQAVAERVLAAHPDDPEAWYLAGRVQHARGQHLAAVSLLEAAEAAGVRAAEHVLPLAESSAAYQAHFSTLETPHFDIRYLNKDEIVASYAAPVLESAYRNIGADLGLLPAERGERIVVEIYPDARGLAGATGLTIKEIETSGTIAVCKFHRLMVTSPLATADGYDWADTIAHELTHLIVSKASRNTIPIWLHEGIAKYFETRWRGKAGIGLGAYGEKSLAEATRDQKFITFREMHPSMAKLPSQEAAALAFAEVFTTIEYLVRDYGVGSIKKLLAVSAEGLDLDAALRRVFGMGMLGVESSWKRYLLRRPFHVVPGARPEIIKLAATEKEASTQRPLEAMKDREAHDLARLGELLQLRGHEQAAVVEYEKAYARSGVTYATLVYRLARAYLETHRERDAAAVLEKALAVHPDEGDLRLLAGRARLAAKDLDGARAMFESVRLRNPFNPEIHEALRQLYDARGDHDAAAQEAHFLELSRQPRPTRTYERPAEKPGAAYLDVISVPFGDVRLDGGEVIAAPTFHVPVAAGTHELTLALPGGGERKASVTVAAGATERVIVR